MRKVSEAFVVNIQRELEARGVKAAPFSAQAGLSVNSVGNIIKSNGQSATLQTIEKIAEALNISVAELLSESAEGSARELLEVFQSLSHERRRLLLAIAKTWQEMD